MTYIRSCDVDQCRASISHDFTLSQRSPQTPQVRGQSFQATFSLVSQSPLKALNRQAAFGALSLQVAKYSSMSRVFDTPVT